MMQLLEKIACSFKGFERRIVLGLGAMLVLVVLGGCVGSQDAFLRKQLSRNHCYFDQEAPYNDENEIIAPTEAQWKALRQILPERAAHAAVAARVVDEVIAFKVLKESYATDSLLTTRIDMLELRQSIADRIHSASLEISAIAAQIDCEEERSEQVASFIKRKEDKRDKELTAAAIGVGAAGAIASGAILLGAPDRDGRNTVEIIGISVGITEAALGTALLVNKKRTDYNHPYNHLRCIWQTDELCDLLPPAVAYFLSQNIDSSQTYIERMRQEYLQFGPLSEAKNKKERDKLEALFFGNGGTYTAEQLIERANMLDQLEAMISLMKEDLRLLMKMTSTL